MAFVLINKADGQQIEEIFQTLPRMKKLVAVGADMDKAQIIGIKSVYHNVKVLEIFS